MKTDIEHDNVMETEKEKINRWNESIKKIPQKDEYELEGIKNWNIYDFKMVPNSSGMQEELFRDEGVRLLDAGFDLAINTEYGVGDVHVLKDRFRIELWQNDKKKDIYKDTLGEVLDWIIYFYERCPKPRTKYTKHGVKRQHQIIDGILPVLEKISEIDGVKKVNPGKISYSPKRGIYQPMLKIQRQTITGFKLIAHSKGAIQEIFVVVKGGKAAEVQRELRVKMKISDGSEKIM